MAVGDESIVDGLDVCGVEPDRGTDAGLSYGCEIGAGNDVAECERDRLRLEDDGVRRSGLRVPASGRHRLRDGGTGQADDGAGAESAPVE